MQVQELVTLVPWTFIASIINLFLQAYLLKKFLFKPVNEILAKRRAMADAEIQDAVKEREEAAAMKTEYEAGIAAAKDKANEIVSAAQKSADAQSERIVREAQDEAAAIRSRAERDIAQEKKKAIGEIKNEIGSMAMDIAGKVIERELTEEDHRKLIDEYIQNVGEVS